MVCLGYAGIHPSQLRKVLRGLELAHAAPFHDSAAGVRQALEHSETPCEVLCFPWQTVFVRDYLGGRTGLREVTMDALEDALGLTDPEDSDPHKEVPP